MMPKLVQGKNDFYSWCIRNNRDDLLSQYSSNNLYDVNNISYSSHKNVNWVCPMCGNEYKASLTHRTAKRGTGCPNCAKRFSGSVADLAIYNYFKHYYKDTRYRNRELGFELDVVIPELKIAVEYDGIIYHDIINGNSYKGIELKKYGYNLIRIIGATYDIEEEYNRYDNEIVMILNQDSSNHHKNIIIFCIETINKLYNESIINIDYEVLEDSILEARRSIINKESKNKLSDRVPSIIEYYKPELNGNIQLYTISAGSHQFLNLECPKCSYKFRLHINNIVISLSKGNCICPLCKKHTPSKKYTGVRRSIDQVFLNIENFWSDENKVRPSEVRAEERNYKIVLKCPNCGNLENRVPQQMCNNNYRRKSPMVCKNCRKHFPLQITSDRRKRHNMYIDINDIN